MPIVFSAIVPHPPILIPSIGKENINAIKTTSDSYLKLEQNLYASQAETIVIISPHGHLQEKSFTLNLNPEFYGNFEEFGDMATKFKISCDIGLAYKIKEKTETQMPLQLISEPKLDYGTLVPIFLLTQNLPKIKIIPFFYSGLNFVEHYNFGKMIKNELLNSCARVAVIASGDLSHKLEKNSPAGFSRNGKKFDKKLIDNLLNKQTDEIIKSNSKWVADVGECGLKSIIILLGILDDIKYEPQLLSYEAPFGVGYMVMDFYFC